MSNLIYTIRYHFTFKNVALAIVLAPVGWVTYSFVAGFLTMLAAVI